MKWIEKAKMQLGRFTPKSEILFLELRVCVSQFWLFILELCNSEFIFHYFDKKKSQNCEIKSHNYFLIIL